MNADQYRDLLNQVAFIKVTQAKQGDDLQDIQDRLAFVIAALEELLRRVPEPRCAYCGQGSSLHSQKFGVDHEFIV